MLLQSRGDDGPSGEDLEYDPVFMELEIAAQPGEERQAGEEILAAEEPDYKEVSRLALEVLSRSHDLRAAIYYGEAQLRLNGLPGFAEATTLIRCFLENFWDSCHPQLDADDDDDPTMRVNAVLALADSDRILRGVRRAPLTRSRMFGNLSLRHIAVAEGEIVAPADMDDAPDANAVAAAFQDTDEDTLRGIAQAVGTALADVQAISAKFDLEAPGQGPDLDPLIKLMKQAESRLMRALGGTSEAAQNEPASAAETDGDASAAPAASRPTGGGGINSPTDVINTIDRIIAYYQRSEPSSPLPLLLVRAKRLVNADFLTIVKDLAPLGLSNVNVVGGLEDEDD